MRELGAREIPVELVQFLVVDDHKFVRHIVAECLKSHDVRRFAYAESGDQALEILKRQLPKSSSESLNATIVARDDVPGELVPGIESFKAEYPYCVITDFKMGAVNGLHVLKAIRCGETLVPRSTPVILLTGFSDELVVSAALQLDVNAFVLKPVSNQTLWERIQRVLKLVAPAGSVINYVNVSIPDDGKRADDTPNKPQAPPKMSANVGMDIEWMRLKTLKAGSVLAQDLCDGQGNVILRKNTEFSNSLIQKLWDLETMNSLAGGIPIKRVPSQ